MSHDNTGYHFRLLYHLLSSMGLPINQDKLNAPSGDITGLGIIIYIHKRISTARIFINRMLVFFFTNSHENSPFFPIFSGSQVVPKVLPISMGVTLLKKPVITDLQFTWTTASQVLEHVGHLKIVHLEMITLVVAFRLWANYWRHLSIHLYLITRL